MNRDEEMSCYPFWDEYHKWERIITMRLMWYLNENQLTRIKQDFNLGTTHQNGVSYAVLDISSAQDEKRIWIKGRMCWWLDNFLKDRIGQVEPVRDILKLGYHKDHRYTHYYFYCTSMILWNQFKIQFNVGCSQTMWHCGHLSIQKLKLNENDIEVADNVKYLGLIIDQQMTFQQHINYVYGKAAKKLDECDIADATTGISKATGRSETVHKCIRWSKKFPNHNLTMAYQLLKVNWSSDAKPDQYPHQSKLPNQVNFHGLNPFFTEEWNRHWTNEREPHKCPKRYLCNLIEAKSFEKIILHRLEVHERRYVCRGKVGLNGFLFKIKRSDSSDCKWCENEEETVEHFLMECPHYQA
ncbi:hypothetical protein RFI_00584 [Reticulomyxa filosa]|uniref:Reverse transcriptase zinc-binding domain-containing protein n=1 Tax=Reticulomyxa filosa TaxID=46433 RepID=X6PEE8_RETFI|nr:hypothetical protein RFI_00584 [Reticulomyxa filosa]|eukprot:ETO36478.1 hypothetical protein RFI_00584 [Reticulomyxa filosa]